MMKPPPLLNEAERLADLSRYQILDTANESAFDDLTLLAAHICGVPITLVSLVDADRQWFKSRVGTAVTQTSRDISLCAHAISQSELFIVPDLLQDERFATNPLVAGEPHIRFYAGAPLVTSQGHALGTLCVIDCVPRELSQYQQEALRALARQVMSQLELRRNSAYLTQANKDLSMEINERQRSEEALRDSRERYKQVVDQASDIIYKADRDGRFTLVNPTMVRVLKYRAEELTGMRYLDVVHPSYRETVERFYARQLVKKIVTTYLEFPVVARDGTEVWLGQKVQLVAWKDQAAEFQAVARDITERRAAEQALLQAHDQLEQRVAERTAELARANAELHAEIVERKEIATALQQSEQDYRELFESAHDAIIILDPAGETVLEVNQRACETYELTRTEFVGLSMETISQNAARGKQQVRETLHAEVNHRFETVQYRKDGTEMFLEVSATTIDYKGRRAILSINRDITERKHAEEALRESEERYRRIFERDLAGNYISTTDGKLLACNSAFAQIFGFDSVDEAMSCNLASLYSDAKSRGAFLDLLHQEEKIEHQEAELRRSDGTPVHIVESAIGTFDSHGALVEIQGFLFDNSAHKKLEEQLRQSQKMDAVGQLAGGVAHDFNNILTAINGYSDLILMRLAEGDAVRSRVVEIKKAGERAASLTRQLLAFSRKQVLHPVVLNLNTVVADMHKMLERLIDENIDLVTTLESSPWLVKADQGQVEQVLMNLVVNARDAMPQGGKLLVETSNVKLGGEYAHSSAALRPGRYVLLVVSDTGAGMDYQTQARIFEPFFTTKQQGKGTGLGLSTVYGIVKQSGGHTAVYSEVGAGTTFKVYLPQAEEAAQSSRSGQTPAELLRGRETVLLVEDEEMVRAMTRESLQISGYTVLEAANGNEALRLYEQHRGKIDLTLTDVIMPQMSGRELVERLKPLCPRMRVLYMSGYTDNAIVHHGVLEAGTAFLQKPFTPFTLARKVREVLDRA